MSRRQATVLALVLWVLVLAAQVACDEDPDYGREPENPMTTPQPKYVPTLVLE